MNKIFTEDLSKTFITDGIKNSVLRDINFSISQGETCSIIGASGCGKSTFLHLLAKLDDYSSGRIFFNEINYSDLNSDSSASLRLRILVLYTNFITFLKILMPLIIVNCSRLK